MSKSVQQAAAMKQVLAQIEQAHAEALAERDELVDAATAYYKLHGNCGSPAQQEAADRLCRAICAAASQPHAPL